MRKVDIFTDGACHNNPGPGGWGVLLQCQGKQKKLYGGQNNTTNNKMELTAAIKGLKALTRPCEVTIYTDSQYLKSGITVWIKKWKQNNWLTVAKQPVKNRELWQELEREVNLHNVTWHWVKAHSGHLENEIVDQLAKRGILELCDN